MQVVKKKGRIIAWSKEMIEENTKLQKEECKCEKEIKFNL